MARRQRLEEGLERLRRPGDAPLLITVTHPGHRYTLAAVANSLRDRGVWHERWGYPSLFHARKLPRATYVFADFDRLHPWQLEVLGRFHDRLSSEGLHVLNDPRRFVPRAAFLRRLRREGINRFTCWLPAEGEMPDRFPAFLRTICAHRGAASGLLHTPDDASAALKDALARGLVLSDLMFVEYCAEPDPKTGVFRKHACHSIGDQVIRGHTVSNTDWVAKQGTLGAATEENYLSDLAEHHDYPWAGLMRRAFDLSGIEFGRLDYAMVDGQPQIYEINSNPFIEWTGSHHSEIRLQASALLKDSILDAMGGLALRDRGGWVPVRDLVPRSPSRRATLGQP